ncbi:MAG: hypothetical protein CVT89_00355 [Candidatus Altiarchaeales archaeon HGW-Altiarchaeales-2]|nr:MAG: hypothetical protein CVT89_00355 [Candidatus Altiarchaeales archaeon HGW-Altiarchaeales-2]
MREGKNIKMRTDKCILSRADTSNMRKILEFIKYGLVSIFLTPIYLLSHLFPRDKKIWVFECWFREDFKDNSKYLFLYASENLKPKIRPVFLSKNKKLIKTLTKNGMEAHYSYSIKGIWSKIRCKYAFADVSFFDTYLLGGATKVQLWHGSPLKKIEYDARLSVSRIPAFVRRIAKFIAPWTFMRPEHITAPSDSFVGIFASAFRINEKNIVVTGYPRTDIFFRNIPFSLIGTDAPIYEKIKKENSNNKIIMYLPTHRDIDNVAIEKQFDLDVLNRFLKLNNCFLIIKQHHYVNPNLENDKIFDRIIFSFSNIDIYPLLSDVDILITDYSSIFFDFLLLDKPIIFFPYDIDKYISKDRELYFDYNEFVPGPIANTFDDLMQWIEYFIKKPEEFSNKRKDIRDFSFNYIDGNASKRICEFILKHSYP